MLPFAPEMFSKLYLGNDFESILPLIIVVLCRIVIHVYSQSLNDDVKDQFLNALSKIYRSIDIYYVSY